MEQFVERKDIEGDYNLYFIGDLHYPRGRLNKFQEAIDEVKNDKHGYMIGMGDWIEGINYTDKRYNPEETAQIILQSQSPVNMISEQWDMFEETISPMSSKIIGLLNGNHERSFGNKTSYNELTRICKRLDVPYLGTVALVSTRKLKLMVAHGIGGGVNPGFAINQLHKHSRILADVDIIAEGHTHKLAVYPSIKPLKVCGKDLCQEVQYYCACGSFLANYLIGIDTYAENKMYDPLPIGYIKAEIEDDVIKRIFPVVL